MNYRRTRNSRHLFFLTLFFLLLFGFSTLAQTSLIKGRLLNAADQSPLPFVYLRFGSCESGTTSDIDGYFTIPDTIRRIEFRYLGFTSMIVPVSKPNEKEWIVNLFPDNKSLSPEAHFSKEDPARRIIQIAIDRAESNNSENLTSYQYTSYNKFWLSADLLTEEKSSGTRKISARALEKLQQRFEASHMLLVETVSKKKFLHPKHENEEIISSKVSGLKKEAFSLLSTQLQGFSVYRQNFSLLGKSYLSPISKSALRNYAFAMEDTLMTDQKDTVYLIRFHPAKDRNFDGLKGFLHINSHGYAVQSLVAEPASTDKNEVSASVWQHYDRLETGEWFPKELNATVNFKMLATLPVDSVLKKRKPVELSITANSHSYLYQRVANLPLDPKSFPKYGVTLATEGTDSSAAGTVVRYIPLTAVDSTTYHYLDSLGMKERKKQQVKLIHALSLGTIPLGKISINFMYLFGYTLNEGYKLGLGLETNRKFSRYFAAGTYFTYGTKDLILRHGEWLRIFPKGYPDFKIELGYQDIKKEFGVEELLTDFNIFEPEYFRSLLVKNMYQTKNLYANMEIRPIEPLNLKIFMDRATNTRNSYGNFVDLDWHPFELSRVGFEARYSPGIAFLNDPVELIQSTPPKSDYFFSVIQGLKLLNSVYQYTKFDAKAKFNLRLSALGNTSIMVRGGKIFSEAPITDWFHGYGSYTGRFTLLPHYAFSTMRMNEFSADQYAALHIRHNFGKGFIPSYYFIRPELVLAQNIGFGSLPERYTLETGATDFRKGYYESGVELNKILNTDIAGLGFATYYRYGPYGLTTSALNFAYRITLTFRL